MLKRRFNLDESVLREMYLVRNMKVSEIAAEIGCGKGLVLKRLAEHKIRKDKVILSAQAGASHRKFRLTPEEFRDLYLVHGKTMYEVAEIAGVSHSNAATWAGRFGILKPRRATTKADHETRRVFKLDEAALREMYIDQDMTVSMIASMVGFSCGPIRQRLKKFGIKKDNQYTRVRVDREELQRMVLEERLTTKQIGERIGCGHTAVSRHIKKHGLTGLKGGKYRMIVGDGYSFISVIDEAGKRKYVPEHRVVIEQAIGRELTGIDNIHHINEIKLDNRLENLAALTKTDHRRVHAYMSDIAAHLIFNGTDPGPLKFDQPVFWAGQWVTEIDPLRDAFNKIVKEDISAIPNFVG